jgi:carbamoyltransferase
VYHHVLGYTKRRVLHDVFLGQQSNNSHILQTLRARKISSKNMKNTKLVHYIANQLSLGKVVGWFEGRAEFGPRALGHRSIIADPRKAEMKDVVNERVKFREEFRPFAPVVLSRFAKRYFQVTEDNLTPFMLGTFKAEPIARKKAPAVVHEDRTSRIQVVDPKTYSGLYAKVLQQFYKRTRVPVLLNTSFNLKGEPIVNSPADAISTFMRSGLDILVLENFVITK